MVIPQNAVVRLQDKSLVYKVKPDSTATAVNVTTTSAGNGKDVTKQLAGNPHAEICACMDGSWLRIAAELVLDNNHEAKVRMLEKLPALKQMYNADDDSMQMYYLRDASAAFFSFTSAPEIITF